MFQGERRPRRRQGRRRHLRIYRTRNNGLVCSNHIGQNHTHSSLGEHLKMRSLISVTLLYLAIGGTALAQTAMTKDQKQAISKSCTDQVNAKGLHGTARKKFRSECKNNGGKPI